MKEDDVPDLNCETQYEEMKCNQLNGSFAY